MNSAGHQEVSGNSSNKDDLKGTIIVEVYEGEQDLSRPPYRYVPSGRHGLPKEEVPIDKDKKFWTQPSATISCDESKMKTIPISDKLKYHWRTKSKQPLITWKAYYHTPNVIKILQMLPPDEEDTDTSSLALSALVTESHITRSSSLIASDAKATIVRSKLKHSFEESWHQEIEEIEAPSAMKKKAKCLSSSSSSHPVIDLTGEDSAFC
jgi:hypothetical protein